jgi:hypothetical protein
VSLFSLTRLWKLAEFLPQAFDLFEELNISGVIPNMFTFTTLIEACNYRKGGHCHEVSAVGGVCKSTP